MLGNSPENLSPERFFNELYDQATDWMVLRRGARVRASFPPQIVRNWDYHEDATSRGLHLPLDLRRGVLLQEGPLVSVLIVGKRTSARFQETVFGLQFGFSEQLALALIEDPLEKARSIMHPFSTFPCGEIYQHPLSKNLAARGAASIGRGSHVPWPEDDHSFSTALDECLEEIIDRQKQARIFQVVLS